jgi:hypothetical protein
MTHTSYALWGRGDVTPQNAAALLADYMSDQVGAIYRPVDVPRGGLRNAVNFLETAEMYGDGGTIESEDVVSDLIKANEEEGDDVVLVTLWPSDPTGEEVSFVRLAKAAGIEVVNLSGGLDQLDVDNLEAVVPVPEKKIRTSRKLSDPKPTEDDVGTTSPATPELKAAFDAEVAKVRNDPPWEDTQEVVQAEPLNTDAEPVYMLLESQEPLRSAEYVADTMLAVGIREIIRQEIYSILSAEGLLPDVSRNKPVDTIEELKAEVARLRDDELGKAAARSLKHNVPEISGKDYAVVHELAREDKIDYYMTQDGVYRLAAEGLPRRGEVIAPLTQHEIAALTRDGRIK